MPRPLLLALSLAGCPRATPPTPAAGQRAGALLEVGTVTLSRGADGGCRFDDGRRYVVSVHRALEPTPLVDELAAALPGLGLDDDVVLDWFGDEAPARIELVLGRDLDAGLAGLLVELVATHATAPVAVSSLEDDGDTCSRSRAYLGSLVTSAVPTQSAAELAAMAALPADAFWEQVPPSGR